MNVKKRLVKLKAKYLFRRWMKDLGFDKYSTFPFLIFRKDGLYVNRYFGVDAPFYERLDHETSLRSWERYGG